MKRKYFNGKSALVTTIRIGCAAAICMLPAQSFAGSTEAPAPAPAEEPEVPGNWVDFTVGGVNVSGDQGAFQHRTGTNGDFYGGISSMHWEKEANDITWTLDGHALFGNEDYEVILGAEKTDLGYIEAGYRQFRTWYDGSGGYVPGIADGWFPVQDDELSLDRGQVWFEAGLRMEDLPEITFRYTHGWRNGDKDSTNWSRGSGTGANFAIVPSLNEIDETRDTFDLDVTYTLGNTDLGLGLTYENASNDNYRVMPGLNNGVTTTQRDVYDMDLFNTHVSSTSRLNDRMMLSFGYSYTDISTDIGGTTRNEDDGTPGRHDFTPLSGGADMYSNVVNTNFWWNPIDDLVIVPSFRAEWSNTDAKAYDFDEPGEDLFDVVDRSSADYESYTEQLDIRYTGLENIVLYAKGEFNQANLDIDYRSSEFLIDDEFEKYSRKRTSDINQWKATAGANWYPMSCLRFSAEYFHKDYDVDYDNRFDGEAFDSHIASHEISTDDFNIRMTWRALANLTLVTRYDYLQSTYDTRGIDGSGMTLSQIQSADVDRHVLSQSITWMPIEQAYIQGTVSWVQSETDTPADNGAPTVITDSDNDYVTASLTAGYALDQKTEITVGYSYFYSNNYQIPYKSPGVPGSVGYGTSLQENVFSISLNRQISPNMVWNLGYAYYNSNDDGSGGNNDYEAHMVSTGLQIRF